MAEVESLCTRITILSSGKIKFIGTTDELATKVEKKYNIKIVTDDGDQEYLVSNIADSLLEIIEKYKKENITINDIKVNRGTLEHYIIDISKEN